jgi:hypothetical protein
MALLSSKNSSATDVGVPLVVVVDDNCFRCGGVLEIVRSCSVSTILASNAIVGRVKWQ